MKKLVMKAIVLLCIIGLISACGTQSSSTSEKQYTIGVTQIVEHPSLDKAFEGFKAALKDNGFVEGENVKYDVQIAQGDMSNNQTIGTNLVSKKVDLIFANSTPSAQGALNATEEIPIIFTSVTDPLGAELVKAMESPGGNVTGTTDTHPEAIPSMVDFIATQFPDVKKIGFVYNSGEQNSVSQIEMVENVLKEKGLEAVKVSVSTSAEVKQAAESLIGRVDAFYMIGDNTVASALESVLKVLYDKDIPMFAGELDSVGRGCFAGYGFDYYDIGYEAGEMAVQVLKGEKSPAELPVQYPQKLKLVINKKAAEEMGVELKSAWDDMAEYIN
ncbi:ABC transporter substrate-binding protein [Bacillus salitolerans]|uniref:ABC transporter substrate-binding protein n=1 Tax=Bacillus salitolerans TaxID=1437434 RepID=A0ABW4LV86_9BACI